MYSQIRSGDFGDSGMGTAGIFHMYIQMGRADRVRWAATGVKRC